MRQTLERLSLDNIDYYAARLQHPSGSIFSNYFIANIIGRVGAIDKAKSVVTDGHGPIRGTLKQFAIDPTAVGRYSLFRLKESPSLVVIDENVNAGIAAAKLVGVRTQATEEWTGVFNGRLSA